MLVSDFYAAYHHYDGPKQRCWAHLLRDIHGPSALYPEADRLAQWVDAVHQLYCQAKAFTHPQAKRRRFAQLALEKRLLALSTPSWMILRRPRPGCADVWRTTSRACPVLDTGNSSSSWLSPKAPPDNNAAERSLCPVVISRKVSGGTRSHQGTETKMILASTFGTWRIQGFNPLTACRQSLTSPQP